MPSQHLVVRNVERKVMRKMILILPRLKRFKVSSEVGFVGVGGSKLWKNIFAHHMLKA